MKLEIASALSGLTTEPPVETLIQLLKTDPEVEIRSRVVEVLGEFGDKLAENLLIETLLDVTQIPKVRGKAVEVLDKPKFYKPSVREALLELLDQVEAYQTSGHEKSIAEKAQKMLTKMDKVRLKRKRQK